MMQNSKPIHPISDDKNVIIEVSGREASLINKLREYSYGSFTITKRNNILLRLEVIESLLLNEEDGLNIAIMKE